MPYVHELKGKPFYILTDPEVFLKDNNCKTKKELSEKMNYHAQYVNEMERTPKSLKTLKKYEENGIIINLDNFTEVEKENNEIK